MAALFGRCVYKGSCEFNKAHSTSSICLACKHLAAFHEQGNLTSSASSTRPPSVETLTAKDGTPCTSTALNEAKRFGKTKSFAEWKAEKSQVPFGKSPVHVELAFRRQLLRQGY